MAAEKLSFGTGGIRGIRGAGPNKFNADVVSRVAEGHARHLKEKASQGAGFMVAYDARHQSKEFAKIYAEVVAGHGFSVTLCREPRPTPFLSYWIKKKSCIGGACITASHNPGEYSGIKVYAATGGQVVHPEDKEIMRAIDSVEESFVPAAFEGSIDYLEADDDRAYIEDVATTLPMSPQKPGFDVAFTALHGCAGSLFQKFYRHLFQSELHIVEEQFLPDGDFPTVVQPNPEIPSTMHMVEKLGREKNCEIVLATDGDGDRIGFAEWDSAKNKYWYPTGNEILVLLTDFLLSERKQKSELDYCLKTIVSTELTDSVAKHHGASCRSTLTGFKWIADYVENNPELSFVCGGEESFGFLFGRYVSDKDGMSSLALIVQLKAWCRDQGMSIHGKMEAIYARHGYFLDRVDSRVFKSAESLGQVKQGLESLRKNPPQLVAGYKVEKIWDLQNDQYGPCEMTANPRGFSLSASLNMPAANVLQFYLANGSKISVRPSGTEPKMKVYYSLPAAIAKGDRGALTEKFVEIQSHVWSLLGDSRDDSQGVDS